jgi:two-component system chemotaxis sensor kinase CheA
MRAGADPVLLIRELGSLGSLQVNAALGQLPSLEEMDPERCYISWTLELLACTDLNAIKDIFIFVEDTCELSIECLPSEKTLTEPLPTSGTIDTVAKQESSSTRASRPATTENVAGIRVKTAKLDQLVNLVGELVTVQARLSEIASRNDDSDICAVAEEIERLSSALRDSTMNIRMMPIRDTFERFRRLVYDLASDLQKNVRLTIEGADTELDKTVIDHLGDPLLHLIRNCMDHGLETPAERLESGKPAQGNVHLSARYAGASVLIKVTDDGRGINVARVRQRGIERGLIAADAALTDSQLFALIFEPGFSTVNEVTDLSGRGVGMDVVHRNIDKLRGSIDISSELGKGTSITLRIPLTLAIIDGLLVTVGDQYFVLPLAHALECIELSRSQNDAANGKQLIKVRGDIVAYIRLRDYFGIDGDLPDFEQVMLVTTEVGRYGLVVDRVLGDCQTMVKSLGRMYRDVNELSGATVLGNGSVALILDPHRLVQECIRGAEVPSRRPARTFAPDAWERADLTAAGSTSSFTNSNHTASADATGVLHA